VRTRLGNLVRDRSRWVPADRAEAAVGRRAPHRLVPVGSIAGTAGTRLPCKPVRAGTTRAPAGIGRCRAAGKADANSCSVPALFGCLPVSQRDQGLPPRLEIAFPDPGRATWRLQRISLSFLPFPSRISSRHRRTLQIVISGLRHLPRFTDRNLPAPALSVYVGPRIMADLRSW